MQILSLQVRPLTTAEDVSACMQLWHEVYRSSPYWIPPDRHHTEALLTGRGPAAANSQVQTFLAEDGGRLVASVTAVREETYIQRNNEQMGHLLFFEALAGQGETVDQLLATACDWLQSRGCDAVRLSFLPGWQMPPTIDAYEAVPTLFHTYNPPYYHACIKNARFRTEHACVEYQVTFNANLSSRYGDMVKRVSDAGIRLRTWDLEQLEKENDLFTRLFNETFRAHWGFMPLSSAVMGGLTLDLRDFLVPDFLVFAEADGQAVGFVYAVPDLNQAFHRMRGKPVEQNRAEFRRYVKEIDHGVLLIIGVGQDYRGRGINLAMGAKSYLSMIERGYRSASYTLVMDDNWPSRKTAEKLGARVVRSFNIYRRDLK